MTHKITAKNTTITPSIQSYIEKRFEKFSPFIPANTQVNTRVEIKEGGKRHKVEVMIVLGKEVCHIECNDIDMYAAIDNAEKKMVRMLRKRKEKKIAQKHRGGAREHEGEVKEEPLEVIPTQIHHIQPMTLREACEAMETLDASCYTYFDVELNKIGVLYKRLDNVYGILILDEKCLHDERKVEI